MNKEYQKSFFKHLIMERMHEIDFYADKRVNIALTERTKRK